MTERPWLRRAGHGRAPDGSLVTWSVAEGSRSRRWREVRTAPQIGTGPGEGVTVASSLLLELDPDGRFAHLELSTLAGLLTLHPEGDGTLHGNAVTSDGLRHFQGVPWAAGDVVLVEGSVISLVAAVAPLGEARPGVTGGVLITLDLALARSDVTIEPVGPGTWRISRVGHAAIDPDGLPILDAGSRWPLEVDR